MFLYCDKELRFRGLDFVYYINSLGNQLMRLVVFQDMQNICSPCLSASKIFGCHLELHMSLYAFHLGQIISTVLG